MSGEDKHSIIRLKPKVSPDKILAGFPWVYDNELVLDRRTKTTYIWQNCRIAR